MSNLIHLFLIKYLPEVELISTPYKAIFIEKKERKYFLAINEDFVKLFTPKELICLLWHEKGHLDLAHLEQENDLLLNINLALQILIFSILTLGILILSNVYWYLIVNTLLLLPLYKKYKSCVSRRNCELAADRYALNYCTKQQFISLLNKFSLIDKNYKSSLYSTHPSIADRIKNVLKY